MDNRTKGVIAGAAGVALLAGGTTFALWTDSAGINGGTITAGNLEVGLTTASPVWEDVSLNRERHSIRLNEFRMVPGDTIEGKFGIDAALEGDNMTANLTFTLNGAAVRDEVNLLPGLDIKYTVLNATGEVVGELEDIGLGTSSPVPFRSGDNKEPSDLGATKLPKALDNTADLTVVVRATFKGTTENTDLVGAQARLEKLGVTLTQTRPVSAG